MNTNPNNKSSDIRKSSMDYTLIRSNRKQMNHSPLFWAEVEKNLPDYRELRSELKKYRC